MNSMNILWTDTNQGQMKMLITNNGYQKNTTHRIKMDMIIGMRKSSNHW